MELLNLTMTLLWSLIVGMSSAVLLNAKPLRSMLELFSVDSFEIFNCAMCFGFWYSWAVLLMSEVQFFPAFIFALVGSFTAEMTDRKINFN